MMSDSLRGKAPYVLYLLLTVALAGGLYLVSRQNYLLFHALTEGWSVVIAASVFFFALYTRDYSKNSFLVVLGVAYLYVGLIDSLHAMAYKGMGIFQADANLPTQLWVAARYLEGGSLFLSGFFLRKRVNHLGLFALYTVVTAVLLGVVFGGFFPDCFVEGRGLTLFKVLSEYIIVAVVFLSALRFWKEVDLLGPAVHRSLLMACGWTILGELSFTLYSEVYGLMNALGHFFKVGSFYFLHRAVLYRGLKEPYELLFKELRQSVSELEDAANRDSLTGLYNHRYIINELDRLQALGKLQDVALLMIDVDRFKEVNDVHGHVAGDAVLKTVAARLIKSVRRSDLVGRYGGDEFAVILYDIEPGQAEKVAVKIIDSMREPDPETGLTVSLSVGLASARDAADQHALLETADRALYEAKEGGRGGVCVAKKGRAS